MALDFHTFHKCFFQCLLLATLGVLIGAAILGAAAYVMLPFEWSFPFCMVPKRERARALYIDYILEESF
jgi:NhaP-type Na+/H+ or K+/H+ antiporter